MCARVLEVERYFRHEAPAGRCLGWEGHDPGRASAAAAWGVVARTAGETGGAFCRVRSQLQLQLALTGFLALTQVQPQRVVLHLYQIPVGVEGEKRGQGRVVIKAGGYQW